MTFVAPPAKLNTGSRWHRWDPHLHFPGTILNDSFTGENAWNNAFAAIEAATPIVRAIGVTDYYLLDIYERVVAAKAAGALKHCDLLFANVEIRFKIGTVKGNWANAHLLISNEDPNHVQEAQRFLNCLTFSVKQDTFRCNPSDIERLGRVLEPGTINSRLALEAGCLQFKVDFQSIEGGVF